MGQDQQEKTQSMPLLEAWMKSTSEFWGSMGKIWFEPFRGSETPSISKKRDRVRVQESVASALKMSEMLSSAMSEPATLETLTKGINALPEIFMRMAQTVWKGYFHLQQQWLERVGRIGKTTKAYEFEELDQDTFKAWIEMYEKEFRQFLYLPQLGLTRFYQERTARFVDKFNLFEGAIAEFLYVLYLPVEKSFKVMQEKLEELAGEQNLPETSQDYYRMWIKILEGHYMTLFKSEEYTRAMNMALNAMEDFTVARQELLQDHMQMFPVATHKELDDLYKELYELRKRVKRLEKKQENQLGG